MPMADDLDGAVSETPTFDSFPPQDQVNIVDIANTKRMKGEFPEEYATQNRQLEYTAIAYLSQGMAFTDVLTKKGYDPVAEIPKDYAGSVALLTHQGTLTL